MFATLVFVIAIYIVVWLCWVTHGIAFAVIIIVALFYILWDLVYTIMYV